MHDWVLSLNYANASRLQSAPIKLENHIKGIMPSNKRREFTIKLYFAWIGSIIEYFSCVVLFDIHTYVFILIEFSLDFENMTRVRKIDVSKSQISKNIMHLSCFMWIIKVVIKWTYYIFQIVQHENIKEYCEKNKKLCNQVCISGITFTVSIWYVLQWFIKWTFWPENVHSIGISND